MTFTNFTTLDIILITLRLFPDLPIFMALIVALIPAFFAFKLAKELYK